MDFQGSYLLDTIVWVFLDEKIMINTKHSELYVELFF
jgi:hypothetical protein